MLKRKTILKDSKKAAMLFKEAGNLFTEKKMELLALGNSSFCKALENGCKFDQVGEIKEKTKLYSKTKMYLRNAASSYRECGFTCEADWALAKLL